MEREPSSSFADDFMHVLELDSGAHQEFSLPQQVTEGDF